MRFPFEPLVPSRGLPHVDETEGWHTAVRDQARPVEVPAVAAFLRAMEAASEARERAQAKADELGEPVRIVIQVEAGGEVLFTQPAGWVEPRATAGQWTIAKHWDGTETPVRTG